MLGSSKSFCELIKGIFARRHAPAAVLPQSQRQAAEPSSEATIRRREGRVKIYVGLDLGTNSTKVVYREDRRRTAKPMLFGHGLRHYHSFCLPSVAAISPNRELLVGIDAAKVLEGESWNCGLRRFKVLLAGSKDRSFQDEATLDDYRRYVASRLGDPDLLPPEVVTTAYLAYAMALVRRRLVSLREYKGVELDLVFNVCMPIDHYEKSEVKGLFEQCFAAAECLEKRWGELGDGGLLDAAREAVATARYEPANQQTRVFAVPEAVAQVTSYIVSLGSRDGIHAVYDFGAGTTDLSIFNLTDAKAQAKTTWYAARNLPRGTIILERIVATHLGGRLGEQPTMDDVLRALTGEVISGGRNALDLALLDATHSLWEATTSVWREAYSHYKKQSFWSGHNVTVFICGGGAANRHVPNVFSRSWMDNWGPYPVVPLPEPDDFDNLQGHVPFARLAVAYGLTFPLPTILPNVVLPADAPDETPPKEPVKTIIEDWRDWS